MGELVSREELRSAVEAHRELGPGYEDAVVDALVERIEQRLEQRRHADDEERRGISFVLAAISLGVGIPITAIAIGHGLAALAIVWAAIVLVNLAVARRY